MRIDLSGQNFVFPDKCACCGQPPTMELAASASKSRGKRVVHTKTNVWDFPYCVRCVGHVKNAEGARAVAWVLGILSIALSCFLAYLINAMTGMVIVLLALTGTGLIYKRQMARARAQCSADCACVGRAMAYLGWHGTLHQFDLHSPYFARDFMVANQSKLVNLSTQGRTLLAGAGASVKTSGRMLRRYMN